MKQQKKVTFTVDHRPMLRAIERAQARADHLSVMRPTKNQFHTAARRLSSTRIQAGPLDRVPGARLTSRPTFTLVDPTLPYPVPTLAMMIAKMRRMLTPGM